MAIKYDFYKSTGVFGDEEQWHVRTVKNGAVSTDAMIKRITAASTLTEADLKASLSALTSEILAHLSEGKNVCVEGLGWFSPSIGGKVEKDKNGKLCLKKAEVRTVNFRPANDFIGALRGLGFTSSEHLGSMSSSVDEARIPELLARLSEEEGYFSVADFRTALRLTVPTATRLIRKLCEQGVIRKIGSLRSGLYRLV